MNSTNLAQDFDGLDFRELNILNKAVLAKQCWRLIKVPNSLAAKVLKHRYFPELLKEEFELLCIVLWKVWFRSNCSIRNVTELFTEDIVVWAKDFQGKFQRSNQIPKEMILEKRSSVSHWLPPNEGSYKINTDAAVVEGSGKVGIDIIIRNSAGEVRTSSAQAIQGSFRCYAIKRGLHLVCDVGLFPCLIVYDVICNKAAHELARFGLSVDSDMVWLEDCPPCLRRVISGDCLMFW
ncbi:hypothetical protein Ddye_032365 [Dipteronia dyeriana]|uniref:RNase H type-1 domain-containing protein n=1 Tax=Dipteronia dyeriana TaxID=168575 RepID=A0AAD9TKM2_9ROSI|nr:hypothetical protein Ddye_032365 [Dipteronia dyeriana]